MNKEYFIYKIICPETTGAIYVGQTQNLKERFAQHMCTRTSPIGRRIQELKAKKLKPIFVVVEQCEYRQVGNLEKLWIAKLRGEGHILLNVERKVEKSYELKYEIEVKI